LSTLNRQPQPQAAPGLLARAAKAEACGKAIIVGEHAVVYGARAVAMPLLTMCMRMDLEPQGGPAGPGSIRMQLGTKDLPEHLAGVVADACDALGIAPFAMEIKAHSSVLIGAGLGSSASLCIAILRLLARSHGIPLTPERLAQLGNRLERRFHGNPSGLDTAVVACEDVISFVKGKTPEGVKVRLVPAGDGRGLPWRFALIDTGVRSSTMAMIQIAASYFQAPEGHARLERFDQLAATVVHGLAHGQLEPVAAAMNEAATHLAAAGVVNTELQAAINEALGVGALAAKPTGSGGGGCALALLDPHQAETQLAALRERLGATRVHGVSLP
jgi:mevalonate kinase